MKMSWFGEGSISMGESRKMCAMNVGSWDFCYTLYDIRYHPLQLQETWRPPASPKDAELAVLLEDLGSGSVWIKTSRPIPPKNVRIQTHDSHARVSTIHIQMISLNTYFLYFPFISLWSPQTVSLPKQPCATVAQPRSLGPGRCGFTTSDKMPRCLAVRQQEVNNILG